MKFKLGNTQHYIEVELVYTITQINETKEFFICTEDILNEYSLTAENFIKFLQQELPADDLCYKSAFELWIFNKGIYSKKNLGLKKRIISGLNEVFKENKNAIVLEEDCLPHEDFFFFF